MNTQNGIRIAGGTIIPFPSGTVENTDLEEIPAAATQGRTAQGIGGGKFQYNVFAHNRLIGYAVYSNGCGHEPAGFLRYEPAPTHGVPPVCLCSGCGAEIGELDADLWFEGLYDAASANAQQRCDECQYLHETDETRFYTL
jgi:hypothetical protein